MGAEQGAELVLTWTSDIQNSIIPPRDLCLWQTGGRGRSPVCQKKTREMGVNKQNSWENTRSHYEREAITQIKYTPEGNGAEAQRLKMEGKYKLKRPVNIIMHVIICLNADTEDERWLMWTEEMRGARGWGGDWSKVTAPPRPSSSSPVVLSIVPPMWRIDPVRWTVKIKRMTNRRAAYTALGG